MEKIWHHTFYNEWSVWDRRMPMLEMRPSPREVSLPSSTPLSTESSPTGMTWRRSGTTPSTMNSVLPLRNSPSSSLRLPSTPRLTVRRCPRSCSRPSICPPCMLPSRLSSPSMSAVASFHSMCIAMPSSLWCAPRFFAIFANARFRKISRILVLLGFLADLDLVLVVEEGFIISKGQDSHKPSHEIEIEYCSISHRFWTSGFSSKSRLVLEANAASETTELKH